MIVYYAGLGREGVLFLLTCVEYELKERIIVSMGILE